MANSIYKNNASIATKTLEMSAVTPQIMGLRFASLLMSGMLPEKNHHDEMHLMWSEKTDAFVESWQAMAKQGMEINQQLAQSYWQTLFTPWWMPQSKEKICPLKISAAALSIVDEGIAPIHKQALKNLKRLKQESSD